MQVLEGDILKVLPESRLYGHMKAVRDTQRNLNILILDVSKKFDIPEGVLGVLSSTKFGLLTSKLSEEDLVRFDKELLKKVESNGLRYFKKQSKMRAELEEALKPFNTYRDSYDDFLPHDMFGLNNVNRSQFLDEVLYVEVDDIEEAMKTLDSYDEMELDFIAEADYRDYLAKYLDTLEDSE